MQRPRGNRLLVPLMIAGTLLAPGAALAESQGRSPALNAEAVLLVDAHGHTLFAKNAQAEHAPASLVKLMTLYLAFEDVEAGRVDLDEPVVVGPAAAATPRYRIGLRAGEEVPLRVLLEAIAIVSANDAAAAVAEHLGGDETTFVAWMNAKAHELGMTRTRYANPHGLPDPLQWSSARDIAVLLRRLLLDHPGAGAVLGARTFTYRNRVYGRYVPLFDDPGGIQALKTGFTVEAGYNLAVSAWRAGERFVMIVLGARSRALSYLDGERLLRYGFTESGLAPAPAPAPRRAPTRPVRARRTGG